MSARRIICDNCGNRQGIDIDVLRACSRCNKDKYVAYYCNESCQHEAYAHHHRVLCTGNTVHDDDTARCYGLHNIPGKGIGAIATRVIKRGEVILLEEPTLRIRHTAGHQFDKHDITSQFDALNADNRKAVLDLHIPLKYQQNNLHEYDKVQRIVKCNGYYDSVVSTSCTNLYVRLARFNHSCSPNAAVIYLSNNRIKLICIYDIPLHEEISVTYIEGVQSRDDRRRKLLIDYDFTCQCQCCSLTGDEQVHSDARRQRLAKPPVSFDDAIANIELCNKERMGYMLNDVRTTAVNMLRNRPFNSEIRKLLTDSWHTYQLEYGNDNAQSKYRHDFLFDDYYWRQ